MGWNKLGINQRPWTWQRNCCLRLEEVSWKCDNVAPRDLGCKSSVWAWRRWERSLHGNLKTEVALTRPHSLRHVTGRPFVTFVLASFIEINLTYSLRRHETSSFCNFIDIKSNNRNYTTGTWVNSAASRQGKSIPCVLVSLSHTSVDMSPCKPLHPRVLCHLQHLINHQRHFTMIWQEVNATGRDKQTQLFVSETESRSCILWRNTT